jgi:RHS repeat-associated protein
MSPPRRGSTRSTSAPANYLFTYEVSDTGSVAVTTKAMNDSLGYVTSVAIYDALLRLRQTQSRSPQSGRLVTDTFYDSRGWATMKYGSWWDPGSLPNSTVVSAANLHAQVPMQAMYTYDGLGRTIREVNAKNGLEVSAVTTIYQGDRTTSVPPAGATVSTAVTDPLGRTVALDEYLTRPTVTAPADTFTGRFTVAGGVKLTTAFGYDGHGGQSTVTSSTGKVWSTTADLLGLRITRHDPDTGDSSQSFDDNGNLVERIDGRGRAMSYTYDAVNRRTNEYAAKRVDQSTANRTASWAYDNSNNAVPNMTYPIGQATTEIAYRGGAEYKVQARGFNVFGKSLGETVTIPTVTEGDLGGTYQFIHQYSTNTGLKLRDVYQPKGNLPAETVNYGYQGVLDLPNTVGGLRGYADGMTYDAYGRVTQQTLGAQPNTALVTNVWDDHTGRLTSQLVTKSGGGTPADVDKQAYEYDLAGNVIKQTSTRSGGVQPNETQCYRYDGLDRLTNAWTATDNCATQPSPGNRAMVGTGLGAANAYWTSWTVNDDGNRTKEVRYGTTAASDETTVYTYDGNGKNQPNTVTSTATTGASTTATNYDYDVAGNMTVRNAGDGQQSLNYDNAGRLTGVTGSTAGNSTFLYDANGSLLIQRDPTTTTLYLGSQQLVLDRATGTVTGTRHYNLPGGGTVVRNGTAANAIVFKLTDLRGTPSLYLDSTAQTPTWRLSTPYGGPRSAPSGPWVDNRGFLDKPVNPATGLNQIGARNYDPKLGRFISPDPIFDLAHPQTFNGYAYANNNPVTMSDPSGLNAYDQQTPCARYNCGAANVDKSDTATENATNNEENGWISPRKRQTLKDVRKVTCAKMLLCSGKRTLPGKPKNDPNYVAYMDIINHRHTCSDEGDVPCAVALEILLQGGDPASAYEVLNNPCDYLYCSTPLDMLLGGHVIEYPWPHFWVQDAVLGGIAAGTRPSGGQGSRGAGAGKANNFPGGRGGRLARMCNTEDSFTPDTRVLLADGRVVPIRDVRVGDVVLATDPVTGRTTPQRVTATWSHVDLEMTDLQIVAADGVVHVLHTTPQHAFWSDSRAAWISAGDLHIGDTLRTATTRAGAQVIAVSTYVAARTMLDLTVGDVHTYYVLAGDAPVLVHNDPAPVPPIIQDAIDAYNNGQLSQRMTGKKGAEVPDVFRGDTGPIGARNFWRDAKIYDVPGGGNDWRLLVKSDGTIGWVGPTGGVRGAGHNYDRISTYKPPC